MDEFRWLIAVTQGFRVTWCLEFFTFSQFRSLQDLQKKGSPYNGAHILAPTEAFNGPVFSNFGNNYFLLQILGIHSDIGTSKGQILCISVDTTSIPLSPYISFSIHKDFAVNPKRWLSTKSVTHTTASSSTGRDSGMVPKSSRRWAVAMVDFGRTLGVELVNFML